MAGLTDGARSTQVDPGKAEQWESMLNDAVASIDVDATKPFEPDDPAASAPQSTASGTSDGTGNGSPDAPAAVATGDDGTSGTTEAPSADTPSDASTDPLANASPFTFTVGDETRSIDGTYRIPGEGLVVPEDKVPQFQLMASRAETLERQNKELYDQSQTWDRLTAWHTKDEQGNAVTLTGRQGFEAQRVSHARALAALQAISEAFASDDAFARLATTRQDEQGNVFLIRNPDAMGLLKERMDNAAYRAENTTRSHLSKASVAPTPEPSASDYAKPTITKLITDHKIDGLTQADQDFLVNQFPRYVTQDGKALDPAFLEVMKDRAALRAEQTKAAEAAKTAGKFNGAMTAARTPQKAPIRPTTTPATAPKKVGKQEQWQTVFNEAMQDIVI